MHGGTSWQYIENSHLFLTLRSVHNRSQVHEMVAVVRAVACLTCFTFSSIGQELVGPFFVLLCCWWCFYFGLLFLLVWFVFFVFPCPTSMRHGRSTGKVEMMTNFPETSKKQQQQRNQQTNTHTQARHRARQTNQGNL